MLNIPTFYQQHSPYTEAHEFFELLSTLKDDFDSIGDFIKQIIIHPQEAIKKGVRANYKMAMRDHVFRRTVQEILSHPKIQKLVTASGTKIRSDLQDRAILGFEHCCLLFASALRIKKHPVRLRSGYASCLVQGKMIPHWICEVWDERSHLWKKIDPEQGIFDSELDKFMPAGEYWLRARCGDLNPDRISDSFKRGYSQLKFTLFNDINGLMKQEFLSCDWRITQGLQKKPRLFAKPYGRLSEDDLDLLDTLAMFSLELDTKLPDLKTLYDDLVRMDSRR